MAGGRLTDVPASAGCSYDPARPRRTTVNERPDREAPDGGRACSSVRSGSYETSAAVAPQALGSVAGVSDMASRIGVCALVVLASLGAGVIPRAEAFELSGGVGLGGVLIGTVPHLGVSPHAGISWRAESGFMFAAQDMCSILIAAHGEAGPGVYNQTSAAIGYAWERWNLSLGPTLAFYSISACGATLCGRVLGLAPGGRAQVNAYFVGPLGIAVSGSAEWVGGRSRVLPGGVAAMIVAGPVLRWDSEGDE